MDRHALIRNAAKRLIDDAFAGTSAGVAEVKTNAAMIGMAGSAQANEAIVGRFVDAYRHACVSVMDKLQLEDRENALDLASTFRRELLEPALDRFSEMATISILGKRPPYGGISPIGSTSSVEWTRQNDAVKGRLRSVLTNVVEEFQLAVTRQAPQKRRQVHIGPFVDPERIEALRAKSSVSWDFGRLIALCEELNTCWRYGAHHAVAMLTRSLLDHVPPIFGQQNFAGVAKLRWRQVFW